MRSRRRLPLDQLAPYVLPDVGRDDHPPLLDWHDLFQNANPVEIEVGFGKGLFLLNAASSRPQCNFFGIEIIRKYQLYTATRLAIRQFKNVKVACANAKELLETRVLERSVAAVHVYFPDPWWKTRHHKRRLFTHEFATVVSRVLCTGAFFHIASDVEDYFKTMIAIVKDLKSFEAIAPPGPTRGEHDLDYLTNFERKFRKEGRPIFRASFSKH